jgi:hypothetical protein
MAVLGWHHGVSVEAKRNALLLGPVGYILPGASSEEFPLMEPPPAPFTGDASTPEPSQEAGPDTMIGQMPTTIMSDEMKAKAEESGNRTQELLNRMELNIGGGDADVHAIANVSIAISLKRIANSLDVIANAK